MTDPKIKYDIEANVTGGEDAAQLSNLLGGTEATNQAFRMLKKLATSTPFD